MNMLRVAVVAAVTGAAVGAGGTALGFVLTADDARTVSCPAVRQQLADARAEAAHKIGAGAANESSVREAAIVLANQTCFSVADDTRAFDVMRSIVSIG